MKIRDKNVTKLRKIFIDLQEYCKNEKDEANKLAYMKKGSPLTDFEHGRINGMHHAYNRVMKKLQDMIQFAETKWNYVHCREELYREEEQIIPEKQTGPKFKPGQSVCAVTVVFDEDNPKVHVKCDVCDSTGKIKIVGKSGEYTCPVCHGAVKENENPYKYKIIYRHATIGYVRHEEYSDKYKGRGVKFDTKTEYLLENSGVENGGQIWFEHNLFADEKEAQEFCDKYVPSDKFKSSKPVLKTEVGIEV